MTAMKSSEPKVHKKGKRWVYFRKSKKKAESVAGAPVSKLGAQLDSAQTVLEWIEKERARKPFKQKHNKKKSRLGTQTTERLDETRKSDLNKCKPAEQAQTDVKESRSGAVSSNKNSEMSEQGRNVTSGTDKAGSAKEGRRAKQRRKKEKRKLKILKRKQTESKKKSIGGVQSSNNDQCRDLVNQSESNTKVAKQTKDLIPGDHEAGPGKVNNKDPKQTTGGKAGKKAAKSALGLVSKKSQRDGHNLPKKRKLKAKGESLKGDSGAKRRKRDNETLDSGMSSGTETPHLPSEPHDIAANWKALVSKLNVPGTAKKRSQKKKKETEDKNEDEIWFDGVDPALLEAERMSSGRGKLSAKGSGDGEVADTRGAKSTLITRCVALDCEMVGIGHEGKDSILARVSMVNEYGHCIYDKFVKPREKVTDYRTAVSGVRPSDLFRGQAEEFLTVQKEVAAIMKDRLLVGHALKNDMRVLYLGHPRRLMRDTATYPPFREIMKTKRPGLKKLAKTVLGVTVQEGEHSSVEDAQTAMRLYTLHRAAWEKMAKLKSRPPKKETKHLSPG